MFDLVNYFLKKTRVFSSCIDSSFYIPLLFDEFSGRRDSIEYLYGNSRIFEFLSREK